MRDLQKDLEICQKATPGKWSLWPEKCGPEGQSVIHDDTGGVICDVGDPYPRGANRPQQNMEFIVAAHKGWPEAISRAVAAEYKNKELVEQIEHFECTLNEKEIQMNDLHELVDEAEAEVKRITEYNDGLESTICDLEAEVESLQAENKKLTEIAKNYLNHMRSAPLNDAKFRFVDYIEEVLNGCK